MGMDAPHFGQQCRKHVEADRHAADQPERAAQRFLLLADGRHRVLEILEDAMAQLQQRFAGGVMRMRRPMR